MGLIDWFNFLTTSNSPSANASEDMTKLMENQYAFTSKMQANRENQRNLAMGKWRDMLGNQQKYETPGSVGKYVDLMMGLGNELSQIRDPSNKTNVDYNQYKSGVKEYDQLTAGDMSGLDKYLKEIEYTSESSEYGNHRKPWGNPNLPNIHDDDYTVRDYMKGRRPNDPPANTPGHYYIASPGNNRKK